MKKTEDRIERLEERVKQLEESLTPTWAQGEYKHSEPEPEPKKTVRQWLEELPDGYRERALAQMDEQGAHIIQESMYKALYCFKYWGETIEGYDFWGAVRTHYAAGTPLPPLPAEQYNAGFHFGSNGEQYLRLPDGCLLLYVEHVKTWVKEPTLAKANPHTLTEVTEYAVGKFYYLGGDKNHYERYALCVKIDSEVSLVIPQNVSGIVVMGIVSASPDDYTIFEVTPVS